MLREQKAGAALNVKQYPAVVIHSLADARTVLALGRPVTLLSATGAALFAGCGWWRALIDRARTEYGDASIDDILDCADASGLALGALRIGQRRIGTQRCGTRLVICRCHRHLAWRRGVNLASTLARYGRPDSRSPAG